MTSENWKRVICSVFQKKARKRWKTVATDLMVIAYGIKSAYLFDQWSSSPEEMVKLLQLLNAEGLTTVKLQLVVVGTDLLIYSCHSFLANIENINFKFIDVSLSLQKPCLIDQRRVKGTVEKFSNFVEVIKNFQSNSRSEISCSNLLNEWYDIAVEDDVNPSCLFGLFLGYPMVYWFDRIESDENCLSMQPLRLYQVKGLDISHCCCDKIQGPNSFVDGLNCVGKLTKHQPNASSQVENPSICSSGNIVCCFNGGMSYHFDHILFSFTVPEDISSSGMEAEGFVEDWFHKWKSSNRWKQLFSHIWMEQNTVEIQAVTL